MSTNCDDETKLPPVAEVMGVEEIEDAAALSRARVIKLIQKLCVIMPTTKFVELCIAEFGVKWQPILDELFDKTQVAIPNKEYDYVFMQVMKRMKVQYPDDVEKGTYWYNYIWCQDSEDGDTEFWVSMQPVHAHKGRRYWV